MAIRGIEHLTAEDGFTLPFIVDLQSGTYMDASKCVVVRLTHDQEEHISDMGDSERIEYATKHGEKLTYR